MTSFSPPFMRVFEYLVDFISKLFRLHNYSPFAKVCVAVLFIADMGLRNVSEKYCLTTASKEDVGNLVHRLRSEGW
ncbi:MAG: hypothetical protein QXF02_06650 [Candidatus Korarchaeota archaeon]